ncbi:MAG: ion transporter [Actinomycetota bacterium]|nr:ion transporter [Actinomycetota bacterium]
MQATRTGWRERVRHIIFDHDTPESRGFDVGLLALIAVSVLLVMLETVEDLEARYDTTFFVLEWIITILFTIEYAARLIAVDHKGRYARSFFGVVDLMSILPVYVSLILPGAQSLLVIRSLRLLRVFRVLKMAQFISEANFLVRAIKASSRKIIVFLIVVVLINVIVGSTMYLIEGPEHGYDSMFRGVYWSIVTMSTVGFGDIAPSTPVGQVLAAMLMITGYSVIAVPTGIVSAEVASARRPREDSCRNCGSAAHAETARFCDACGHPLSN